MARQKNFLLPISLVGITLSSCGDNDDFAAAPTELSTVEPVAVAVEREPARQPPEPPPQAADATAEEPAEETPPEEPTVELPPATCDNTTPTSRQVQIVFEENLEGCFWGEQGNLDPVDGIITARLEETKELSLQPGETLCSLSVSAQEDFLIFDDELFLTLNDAVMLSSYDYSDRFNSENGLFIYNWNQLTQAYNPGPNDDPNPYCLGEADAQGSSCNVPQTTTVGRFSMSIGGDAAARLATRVKEQERATLGLIISGDDEDTDCKHSKITLNVTLETVSN